MFLAILKLVCFVFSIYAFGYAVNIFRGTESIDKTISIFYSALCFACFAFLGYLSYDYFTTAIPEGVYRVTAEVYLEERGKSYHLPTDVTVFFYEHTNSDGETVGESRSYRPYRSYWPNGGYIEYYEEFEQTELEKPIRADSDEYGEMTVTLPYITQTTVGVTPKDVFESTSLFSLLIDHAVPLFCSASGTVFFLGYYILKKKTHKAFRIEASDS